MLRLLINQIPVAALLFGVWFLLSGLTDLFHLGAGVLAAILVTIPTRLDRRFPVLRFIAYLPWLLIQILISNLRVARMALSPRLPIAPRLVRQPPGLRDDRALTLLGCSITLTPGTVTLDIDSREMVVHALDEGSARDIEEGGMARKVGGVFLGAAP